MKVYVAIGGYMYDREYILGVFANEEDAYECCRRNSEEENDDLYVTFVDEQEVK